MRRFIKFLGNLLQNALLETIILAFFLYLLFERLREAYNNSDYDYLLSRLWSMVMDIGHYWYFYVIALAVLVWWVYSKIKSANKADKERSAFMAMITSHDDLIKSLIERMDKLISKWEKDDNG